MILYENKQDKIIMPKISLKTWVNVFINNAFLFLNKVAFEYKDK